MHALALSVPKQESVFAKRTPALLSHMASAESKIYNDDLAIPVLCPPGAVRDPTHHAYVIPGVGQTRGLLSVLKAQLWPHWQPLAAKGRRQYATSSSVEEGVRVEAQISDWFEERSRTGLDPEPCANRYARCFCEWVIANGYIMAASQWPVFDSYTRVATAIDFLLYSPDASRSKTSPWIAVELKVGFNYGRTMAQGTFRHPDFAHVPCTRTNMAYAQMTAMCATAKEVYRVNLTPMVVFVQSATKIVAASITRSLVYKNARYIRAALAGARRDAEPQQRHVINVE